MKKSTIAILLLVLSLLNVIPLFVLGDFVTFSEYSIPPLALMLIVLVNGILALICKHKGNFFMIRKYNSPFASDKDYTYTPEYEKKFTASFFIYFAAVPFYITLIFFVKNWTQSIFALLLFAIPQIIFTIQGVLETAKEVKADKIKKQQREQELREQERREEMGRWK